MNSKDFAEFHGYKIYKDSRVFNKQGKELKYSLRERRGGKFDKRVTLYILGHSYRFTLSNLILECFDGPMFGYQANHKDRDTMNCHLDNLERLTQSKNQLHWREDEKRKNAGSSKERSEYSDMDSIGDDSFIGDGIINHSTDGILKYVV